MYEKECGQYILEERRDMCSGFLYRFSRQGTFELTGPDNVKRIYNDVEYCYCACRIGRRFLY